MATTTILQYLQHTGKSVTTGASVELGTSPLDRKQEETFMCESAIVKGQVLALDVTKMVSDPTGGFTALTVIAGDFNSVPVQKLVVGVASEAVTGTATSPQPVRVIVRGPALAVPAIGAIAQGAPVILDPVGAAGSCSAQVTVNEGGVAVYQISEAFGFAMTAAAAGVVNVYVLGKGI